MKPAIIIAIVIVLASIGLVFILTSQQGTNPNFDWSEAKEKITKHCESIYLEDGFDSVEDCVMYILARVEVSTSQKS